MPRHRCGWCGRPGTQRRHREEAFGRVVVVDPVLCDVCAGLLDLAPGREGDQRHDAARDLALDTLGQADPVNRTAPQPLTLGQLRRDRDQARAVARLLAAELVAYPGLSREAARLLADLPPWVTDPEP